MANPVEYIEDIEEAVKISFYYVPMAEENFPIDEMGAHSLTFQGKRYQFSPTVLRYSPFLMNQFKSIKAGEELNLSFKYGKSAQAFDLMMKLLSGFKEVVIPKKEYVQFLIILDELKVDDKTRCKERTEELILAKLDDQHIFEAYEMAINLEKASLKDKCVEMLTSRKFKPIIYLKEKLNKISEKVFLSIMQDHYEKRKENQDPSNSLQAKELVLVINDYCIANYPDENERKEKMAKYKQQFLAATSDEAFETLYDDKSLKDEKFLKMHLDFVQSHLLKVEKQIQTLTNENASLKVQLEKLEKLPEENAYLQKQLELILEQNHLMKATNEELKVKLEALNLKAEVHSNEHNKIIEAIKEQFDQFKLSLLHPKLSEPPSVALNGESSLIDDSHNAKLHEWILQSESPANPGSTLHLNLVYKGSRDGFKYKAFHEKCDNKSSTITVIKSKDYGRIFGGYTQQTWNFLGNGSWIPKNDASSFLFSLTHNERYPHSKDGKAICINKDCLMCFGNSYSIKIYENCNARNDNYTIFPDNFICSKFNTETVESRAYLAGSDKFIVEEIEVFHITWV